MYSDAHLIQRHFYVRLVLVPMQVFLLRHPMFTFVNSWEFPYDLPCGKSKILRLKKWHSDKNPYSHDRRADKDSYPHDNNNQCIILRLQLSFAMINVQ